MAILFGVHLFAFCAWAYILHVFQKWNISDSEERILARLNFENRTDSDKWVEVRVQRAMIDAEIKVLRKQVDMIIDHCGVET